MVVLYEEQDRAVRRQGQAAVAGRVAIYYFDGIWGVTLPPVLDGDFEEER